MCEVGWSVGEKGEFVKWWAGELQQRLVYGGQLTCLELKLAIFKIPMKWQYKFKCWIVDDYVVHENSNQTTENHYGFWYEIENTILI